MSRVLIVGLNYAPEPTGIAPYTAGLARGLQERGHQVRVLTTYPHYPQWRVDRDPQLLESAEVPGVDLVRARHYVPGRPSGARRAASEVSFALTAGLRRWGAPDVVISPSPALFGAVGAELRSLLARRRPAVGVIAQDLYSAGIAEVSGGGSTTVRVLTAVERRALARADGVAAIHDRFKTRIVEQLGVDPDRVTVIRNWTHVTSAGEFDRVAVRAAHGWAPDELVVLHTGAMGEKQGLANVVEAARLADESGARVRFVLAGDGGQRAQLKDLGAGVERLQFLPPVPSEEYSRLLASADLLLVNERPGVQEMAVPSKLTSYFGSGVPVLAATEEGSTTADELRASRAGTRVDPGRPEDLVKAVLRLRDDPTLRAEMGARGPAYCERLLSEQVALDAYDAWVRKLHRRKHGEPA